MTSIYLLLSILLLLIIKAKSSISKHRHRLPPGPWTLPIIGSLHHLICSGLPHRALRNLSNRYGPIMFLQIGEWPTIIISSREGARMIIKTHEAKFRNRPDILTAKIFSYGGKDVGLSPYSEYWKEIRRILTSEFLSRRRGRSFRPIREEEVLDLIRVISSLSSCRQPINLTEILPVMVNKVSVRAVTGRKYNEEKHVLMVNELQLSSVLSAGFSMADLFPSSRVIRLISGHVRKAEECHQSIDQLLDSMIQEHRAIMFDGEAKDLFSVVLRLHAENSISMDTAKAILFDAVQGTTDAVSALLEWVMSELVRNPRVMKKAQDEVRRLRGRKIIKEFDLAKLNFLRLVIKETLRLHPVVPLIPRVCQETLNLFGHEICKGTTVLVNVWSIGRESKYWKNAEEFKPERFSGDNSDSGYSKEDFEFFPFGAGHRTCPGRSYASEIVELIVANLLYHFNWELPCGLKPDELDMTETIGVVLKRKTPLLLHAIPHCSS